MAQASARARAQSAEDNSRNVANILEHFCPTTTAMMKESGASSVGSRKRKKCPSEETKTRRATAAAIVSATVVASEKDLGGQIFGAKAGLTIGDDSHVPVKSAQTKQFERAFRDLFDKMVQNRKEQGDVICAFCRRHQKLFSEGGTRRIQFILNHVFVHSRDKFTCAFCDFQASMPFSLKIHAWRTHGSVKSVAEYIAEQGVDLEDMIECLRGCYADAIGEDEKEDSGITSVVFSEQPLPVETFVGGNKNNNDPVLTERQSEILDQWIQAQDVSDFTNAEEMFCSICRTHISAGANCAGLMQHAMTHSHQALFTCRYCLLGFNDRGSVNTHVKEFHDCGSNDDGYIDQSEEFETEIKVVLTTCFVKQNYGNIEDLLDVEVSTAIEEPSELDKIMSGKKVKVQVPMLQEEASTDDESEVTDEDEECEEENGERLARMVENYTEERTEAQRGSKCRYRCSNCAFTTKNEMLMINHCLHFHSG